MHAYGTIYGLAYSIAMGDAGYDIISSAINHETKFSCPQNKSKWTEKSYHVSRWSNRKLTGFATVSPDFCQWINMIRHDPPESLIWTVFMLMVCYA